MSPRVFSDRYGERPSLAALRPKPEKDLDSGAGISRLGVSMAHMLNAGKSVVFAFAAHTRTR
jgi:hypothetical protein